MHVYSHAYAHIWWLSAYLFILLLPTAPSTCGRISRLSPSKFKHELSRPAQTSAAIQAKLIEGQHVVLHRDVYTCIPMHTLVCLYFYPWCNLWNDVATLRQIQGLTYWLAAGAWSTNLALQSLVTWGINKVNPGYFSQVATGRKPQQLSMFLHISARVWGRQWSPHTSEQKGSMLKPR